MVFTPIDSSLTHETVGLALNTQILADGQAVPCDGQDQRPDLVLHAGAVIVGE